MQLTVFAPLRYESTVLLSLLGNCHSWVGFFVIQIQYSPNHICSEDSTELKETYFKINMNNEYPMYLLNTVTNFLLPVDGTAIIGYFYLEDFDVILLQVW